MNNKETIDLFNKAYSSKGMYFGWKIRCEFKEIIDSLDFKGKNALDIGCGEGRYSIYLAQKGFSVTALDSSDIGINKLRSIAKEKKLKIKCEIEDIQHYEFFENKYDLIVMAYVLDHLDQQTRDKAITGIKKSLKSGGVFLATVFTIQDPGCQNKNDIILKKSYDYNNISECGNCIKHYYNSNELKKEFSELELIRYGESLELDFSHGKPHFHGVAIIAVRK